MSDFGDVTGRSALVTGASAGIGRATARLLADHGANVALAARRGDELEDFARSIDRTADAEPLVCPTDVSDLGAVRSTVEATVEAFGGIDIVVNNAGVGQSASLEELPLEAYRTLNGVNIDGVYFVTRTALSHLRESRGNLIFVGSTASLYHEPGHPLYAASKWWTRGFAANLAGAVGEDDVAVTVVHPTAVRTEFGSAFRAPNREQYEAGSVLEPEDVAEAVLFAATRSPPQAVNEIELVRRNEFSGIDRF